MQILNKYKDKVPPEAVYIGRGSPLGNPFVIGEHGTRPEVIAMYHTWLKNKLIEGDPVITTAMRDLHEQSILVCFCKPVACHGEVVEEFSKEIAQCDTFDQGLLEFRKRHNEHAVYEPKNDGIDHINTYSKGHTLLGRMLSNFYRSPFRHPEHGAFASVEAFWYYLGTGSVHEALRPLSGYDAKKLGQTLPKVPMDGALFISKIVEAIDCKIANNASIQAELRKTDLPFTHYYYYGDIQNPKVVPLDQYRWMLDTFEAARLRYNAAKKFSLIVAGSRDIADYDALKKAYMQSGYQATEIVSGGARGPDKLGERLAEDLGIAVKQFIPDWDNNPRGAGYVRNAAMGDYADALLTLWDGESKGTLHMQTYMTKLGKPVHTHLVPKTS